MGQAAGAASTDGRKAARLETERKSVKQNRNEHLGLDGQSAVTERRGRQERPAAQPRAGVTVVTGCGEVEGSTRFLNALWARLLRQEEPGGGGAPMQCRRAGPGQQARHRGHSPSHQTSVDHEKMGYHLFTPTL